MKGLFLVDLENKNSALSLFLSLAGLEPTV